MESFIPFLILLMAGAFYLGWRTRGRRQAATARPEILPPTDVSDPDSLSTRLHELEDIFGPFASNSAHPGAVSAHAQFQEAVKLLVSDDVPLETVLQYVEGANWALACAALAALKQRADGAKAIDRVVAHCGNISAWVMHFALDFLAETKPRAPVGAPVVGARDWWVDVPAMLQVFRDYFARREELGDTPTFGTALDLPGVSPTAIVKAFLRRVQHPFAAILIEELDTAAPDLQREGVLAAVGRFWKDQRELDILVEPQAWQRLLAIAESASRQSPPRSLLIRGEPLVGKTSFLRLLAQRLASEGWNVFEAGGTDLQAGQFYIGQLEGRIRELIDELAAGRKLIWYIPDIVQLALSGTHQGQSASILDQILPAVSAGRLVIWCEATAESTARLVQLHPLLRALLDIVPLEPLSATDTLTLTRGVIAELGDKAGIEFHPDCAAVALDAARQYLGTTGLPGAALLMLKLTAARSEGMEGAIEPRQVLETLSQLSGLPLSILDTKERLDLASVRAFFQARVIGQDEAVETMVQRIAMLKAGLNDPKKPIGVFLFAGPTGTGKTELGKALTEFLFSSVDRLIRLDMSEFQTPESIGKILGHSNAPAEGDSLISRVRKQPFSVILLDEFEKSHPNVWDLFLQVFDEGRQSDAMGRTADFRHCLIILTTNLGATAHRSLGLGFAPQADVFTAEQIMRAVSQTYRPEFQNRLDKVIVFRPLTRDLMRGILSKELAALLERRGLKDREWAIEWESSALEFLLEKGFSPEMGARPLKRAIDQYVVAPLAAIIVEERFPEGEQFVFMRSDGQAIQAEFVDPDADVAASPEAREAATASALAAMVLAPEGSQAEFQALETECASIEQTLASAEWQELKARLSGEMTNETFWHRSDRFDTLASLALMDRVKTASETAQSLRARLGRSARPPRPYSRELIARLAMQVHLVKQGIADVFEDAPIEVALSIEPVFEQAGDRRESLAWCNRLMAMYRAWADKRRMHVSEVSGDKDAPPILVVSGFGAHRTLAAEAGLHVLEKSEGEGATTRVTAQVRLAEMPLGDVPAAKAQAVVTRAVGRATSSNAIVRRYREEPPLVRNADGRWRTGRLDLVLAGEFDLMGAGQG